MPYTFLKIHLRNTHKHPHKTTNFQSKTNAAGPGKWTTAAPDSTENTNPKEKNHGGASRDSTEDTWSAKYSCVIGDDTFTVTTTRENMLINRFEEDENLAAVEAWADFVEALSTQQ